ncbi:4a-hydroxytetrahydrobiopterin dehydratase [Ferrovum sp.]|uniref:4a-hydroxytetrahydrobiopterin dehydratase n=1 Tax=Ferrovum sp. TaxID=2609467 RepID=UPI00262B456D|nr:4a-hydroxytetrahydrobiopterin dehydratase [Ferrovum sp.]
MDEICALTHKHCKPCEGGVPPLSHSEITPLLAQLDGWVLRGRAIEKSFGFKNYYQTMAFVNAVAWLAHCENHHPDMTVSYNQCRVEFTTHALDGLSENDFICAARVDALFKGR